MAKSILIIGAGIGGLAAGCYAQMNGYQSRILEMHNIPGGLCTAWKRKGYTFDISIHILTGSSRGSFHRMWEELGALQGRQFAYRDELTRVEGGGKSLSIGSDLERLAQEATAISPVDAPLIRELIGLIRRSSNLNVPMDKAPELQGPLDLFRQVRAVGPMIGIMRRYGKLSLQDWVARFHDPFLRDAIRFSIDSPGWPMPNYPMAFLGIALAEMMTRNCGTPIGGSQALVFDVARRYEALGGGIQYRARVDKILVENDRAVGVRLSDGTEQRADVVISAADGHATLFEMLEGRYLTEAIRRNYETWPVVLPQVQVMLGVNRDLSPEPHRLALALERPLQIAGEERRWINVLNFCHDPTMAPAGKSVVQVWYPTRYDYWDALHQDRERYKAEKQQIAEATICELDKRWPGLAQQVEVVDVPTPITYRRYTGNWQGSPDGWYMTTRNVQQRMPKMLPGLQGFFMVGQWLTPYAGVPMSAMSGRDAIQILCKQDRKRFTATTP